MSIEEITKTYICNKEWLGIKCQKITTKTCFRWQMINEFITNKNNIKTYLKYIHNKSKNGFQNIPYDILEKIMEYLPFKLYSNCDRCIWRIQNQKKAETLKAINNSQLNYSGYPYYGIYWTKREIENYSIWGLPTDPSYN